MRLFLVVTLGFLWSCASASRSAPPAVTLEAPLPWQSPLAREHPLVGRIFDPRSGTFVSTDDVLRRLREADLVLLGEKHDNPDHHRLQATFIDTLVRIGHAPAVAWEMLETPQQEELDAFLRSPSRSAAEMGPTFNWEERGWPSWSIYQPIAQVALGARLPMFAANIPQETVRALVRQGPSSLPEPLRAVLRLDAPLPPEEQAALEAEMNASHCGHLPTHMLAPMAAAQRARDAQMAHVLLRAQGPAVLIAGAGHVRVDRGVPFHLRALAPNRKVLSVAFVEVHPDRPDPATDAQRHAANTLPFDLVWFTPRVPEEEDICSRIPKHKPAPSPSSPPPAPAPTIDI